VTYFEPPKVIATEVFAEVPEKYRQGGNVRAGRKRTTFLEGPSFDREGNLYTVDIPNGRIFRIAPDGSFDVAAQYDGDPNGLKIHKDGRIFLADHRNGLMLLDPKSGSVTSYLEGPDHLERFKGLNDLVFASNGDLYFTDQGQTGLHDPTGRVFRLTAEGRLDCLLDTIPSPNGLVLSRSERAVFVAVTRANAIWLVPMTARGGINKVGLFVQLPCPGPDGMALDDDGNVAVAHPGLGIVWLFSNKGVPLYRVESCKGNMITNVAYGGDERRFLYMTESQTGTVLRAEMPTPGRAMFSHS
jgi:gluconolactonase